MSFSSFYGYFLGEKPSYVRLRVSNIYGFMETGKTVLSRKIGARIEQKVEESGGSFLFIEGRKQSDILNYIDNNGDEIRGLDYIMLLYDDAGRFFLSREGTTKERRSNIKDYLEIRHLFETLGFKQGTIAILFNIQFYRLLEKTIRNSPMSIWKSFVIMDPEERKEFVVRVGWRYYYFIKIITKAMFISNYRLTKREIKIKSTRKREEIYNWLVNFFMKYNIDPSEEIPSQFAKRFALVELFDDKFIIDTRNDIAKPKNYVRIEIKEDEDILRPRDKLERDRMLASAIIGYKLSSHGVTNTMDELGKSLRILGLKFRSKDFYNISKLIEGRIEKVEEEMTTVSLDW